MKRRIRARKAGPMRWRVRARLEGLGGAEWAWMSWWDALEQCGVWFDRHDGGVPFVVWTRKQ